MEVKSIRSRSVLVFERFLCDVMYSYSRSMDACPCMRLGKDSRFTRIVSTLDSLTNTVISHTFAYSSTWRRKPWQGLFNLVFFTADQSAWLVLNQPTQRGFWRNLRFILYSMVKESTFFVFMEGSWPISTFWHQRGRKTTKCTFEIEFLPCAQPI